MSKIDDIIYKCKFCGHETKEKFTYCPKCGLIHLRPYCRILDVDKGELIE